MYFLQDVDKHKDTDEEDNSNSALDVEEELQNELCKLWDMAMNPVSACLSFPLDPLFPNHASPPKNGLLRVMNGI